MKLRLLNLVVVFICFLSFGGCTTYKDIEKVSIVAGCAIDKDKNNDKYNLTIEIINQEFGDKNSQGKSFFIETEGKTIFDAIRNDIKKTGKKLFWSHSKVIIISKQIAETDVLNILDFFLRGSENRIDVGVFVSVENSAQEVLKAKSQMVDVVSYYLSDFITASRDVSTYIPNEILEFATECSNKNLGSLIPIIKSTKDDKKVIELEGSAVFKEGKFLYSINDDESKIVLLVRDKLKGGILALNKVEFNNEREEQISLEILKSRSKVKAIKEGHNLVMNLEIYMKVSLSELGSDVDYINSEKKKELEDYTRNIVSTQILNLIKKSQEKSADIFDFSGAIYRQMPKYWESIKDDWGSIYKTLKVEPNIKIEINSSSNTGNVTTDKKNE